MSMVSDDVLSGNKIRRLLEKGKRRRDEERRRE
jgi:hypothetical protein